jgi:UDP-N-acetylglucosamine 2-epimerase (non-hydrolysing)
MTKAAIVFGTRPEAIKMAPVVEALRRRAARGANLLPLVYVSAQHREMLDQVLRLFDIEPRADLDVMRPDQSLADLSSRMLPGFCDLFRREKPDLVLVHGDTTTAFVCSLAAFYSKIPVGHVEAGLRTRNRYSPFPEEMNRQLVDVLATYHFAPTRGAVENLLAEGKPPARIVQTGNTVIDALLLTLQRVGNKPKQILARRHPALRELLAGRRRLLLVTCHRRENFGAGLTNIFQALLTLVRRFDDIEIVFPVHPNPHVRETASRLLAGQERIHLLAPLDYDEFSYLMSICHLILTDSGGIQEEAPALNKPVLVLRDTSERPEAVEAGAACVVGTQQAGIVDAATRLLTDALEYARMASAPNPYGDGHAAERIVDFLCEAFHLERAG